MVLLTLCRLRLDQILLLQNDLLEGPAPLHPFLETLLDFFVSHLPALYLRAHMTCLFLYCLKLALDRVCFSLTYVLYQLFEL